MKKYLLVALACVLALLPIHRADATTPTYTPSATFTAVPCGNGGALYVYGNGQAIYFGTDGSLHDVWIAQSFSPQASGQLTQFSFRITAKNGNPGTAAWEIRDSSPLGLPQNVLATGTFTPTTNQTNVIYLSGPILSSSVTYFILLRLATPGSNSNYLYYVQSNTTNPYSGGLYQYSNDAGGSWTQVTSTDIEFGAVTSPCSSPTQTPSPTPIPSVTLTPTITYTPSTTPTQTPTPTPTPDFIGDVITMSDGKAAAVEYKASVGEIGIVFFLAVIAMLLGFALYLYMRSGRNES